MAIATRLRNPTEASAFLSGAGGLDVTVEAIEQPPAIVRVHDGLSQSVSAVIDEAFLEYTPGPSQQQQSGDSDAGGASSQTGDENDSSSETTIIIIAAAVGASVGGVILLVGLLIYFYVCRSKKKAGSPSSSAPPVVNIEMASATSAKSEEAGPPAQAV